MLRKAVFLDRDGVLNRNIFYADTQEWESPRTLDDFAFLPGTFEQLARLRDTGFLLFIVTNQPSYAKGKTSLEALQKINMHVLEDLEAREIKIEQLYVSFHHPKSIVPELKAPCPYRKPSPQALLDALRDYNLNPAECFMIGDRDTDVACALNAGVQPVRIAPDYEETLPAHPRAYNALRLEQAIDFILERSSAGE